jgi:hypothetical protein
MPIRVPMVPEGLERAAKTPDTGSAGPSYGVDAAPMLYQQHERGIHALRPDAGEAGVTEVRSAPSDEPIR